MRTWQTGPDPEKSLSLKTFRPCAAANFKGLTTVLTSAGMTWDQVKKFWPKNALDSYDGYQDDDVLKHLWGAGMALVCFVHNINKDIFFVLGVDDDDTSQPSHQRGRKVMMPP
jgi:hypothetical protein